MLQNKGSSWCCLLGRYHLLWRAIANFSSNPFDCGKKNWSPLTNVKNFSPPSDINEKNSGPAPFSVKVPHPAPPIPINQIVPIPCSL